MRLGLVPFLLLAIAVAAPISTASAQKRCRKGIPCGNSCISANKICRIAGPSASRPAPPLSVTQQTRTSDTAVAGRAAWVGSSLGTTYYKSGCLGARRLSPANLIYFKTEEEARRAGYRHSQQRGC